MAEELQQRCHWELMLVPWDVSCCFYDSDGLYVFIFILFLVISTEKVSVLIRLSTHGSDY